MNSAELAYRQTATQGASGFGLLIALYDTLAGDLRRAAEAERAGNIEKRCQQVNHAMLVIAHLQDWVANGSGGDLADQLTRFYAELRHKMIEAQAKRSPEMLEKQMQLVLDLRRSWQQIENRKVAETEIPAWAATSDFVAAAQTESHVSSWSA